MEQKKGGNRPYHCGTEVVCSSIVHKYTRKLDTMHLIGQFELPRVGERKRLVCFLHHKFDKSSRVTTMYACRTCKVPLCPVCFYIFHQFKDFDSMIKYLTTKNKSKQMKFMAYPEYCGPDTGGK